ncbi:MAG: hypothetical protein JRM98_04560 [Nitrososphaerota archaeon]|nr:hypothetical protein [Nitrososphaerota archaeon]
MENAAHTAEHVFMRHLGDIARGMQVIKVEQEGERGAITAQFDGLTMEQIADAMQMTNIEILTGAPVKEHYFDSLERAREAFPLLRANEDRITPPVRVIEVENIDWTACSRKHSKDLAEAQFFLAYDLHRMEGHIYTIEFAVGKSALAEMGQLVTSSRNVASILNCSTGDSAKRVTDILKSLELQKDINRRLTAQLMDRISGTKAGTNTLFLFDLIDGDQSVVSQRVGEMIKNSSTIVVGTNSKDSDGNRIVILARSNDLDRLNCANTLEKVLAKYGGRGGGKGNFSTGTASKVGSDELSRAIIEEWKGAGIWP